MIVILRSLFAALCALALCGLARADAPAQPDAAAAARLFGVAAPLAAPLTVTRLDDAPPVWRVTGPQGPLGVIASTWEIVGSVGYSGKPIDILLALDAQGRVAGAELVRHNEPILTLGISTEAIAAYVSAFRGFDIAAPVAAAFTVREGLPPVIKRATVSTGVIRDAILRTARTVALGRGLVQAGQAQVDRVSFTQKSWAALEAEGALARAAISLSEARAALAGGDNPPPEGAGPFIEVWAGLIDPPSVGRSLLGQKLYTRATAALGPGDAALFVGSRGMHSHRGTAWRKDGLFDRIEVIQGENTFRLSAGDYLRVDHLDATDAPALKERSIFRLSADAGFRATAPFRVEITATRDGPQGPVSLRLPVDYVLPDAYRIAPPAPQIAETEPLWRAAWAGKRVEIASVVAMLGALYLLLIFQEPFVRRPKLWIRVRIGFLLLTTVWLGWFLGAQLSVVQVVAFLQSLLSGFHWETFLIEPLIFILWGFVALGLLFVGRGIYCGWLCPFGALQELLGKAAQRLGVPQIAVPFVVQERLWAVKYVLFVAILALSFQSMDDALRLAEAEPFKTAVSMRFDRAWPFVLFAVGLLTAGLFIERFYCRYLCPLGAALAIPAKMKLFDWLGRRPQCGRECHLCETKCTVGAIDPLGRINPNECVLCLRCQVIQHDPAQCTVLKNRARRGAA